MQTLDWKSSHGTTLSASVYLRKQKLSACKYCIHSNTATTSTHPSYEKPDKDTRAKAIIGGIYG